MTVEWPESASQICDEKGLTVQRAGGKSVSPKVGS